MINIIEGLKAGTTTSCDYDSNMDLLVYNYKNIGVRARLAEMVNEIPDYIGDLPVGELYTFDAAIRETNHWGWIKELPELLMPPVLFTSAWELLVERKR